MRDAFRPRPLESTLTPRAQRPLMLYTLRRWLGLLQVLVPAGLVLLVVAYEIGPARWIYDGLGEAYHFVAEILFYGTVGPVLAFLLLHLLHRWLEEKETSDVQAQVLAQAREYARTSRELSDDALQTLFAASMLLASLKSAVPDLPPEAASSLLEIEQSLDLAIQKLRNHLQL